MPGDAQPQNHGRDHVPGFMVCLIFVLASPALHCTSVIDESDTFMHGAKPRRRLNVGHFLDLRFA
jgi:hypothetical protein